MIKKYLSNQYIAVGINPTAIILQAFFLNQAILRFDVNTKCPDISRCVFISFLSVIFSLPIQLHYSLILQFMDCKYDNALKKPKQV